jgi:NAD(P)-dependent dehydrogenase (short-subunit alcohol dehydrogenase family)
MGRLAGKAAIVTGSASGIGRASVRLFAAEGASVLAFDRDEAGLAETAAGVEVSGTGTAIRTWTGDAGSEADVAGAIAEAERAFGGLDVIYANAGISGGLVPLLEQPVELWEEILRVNLIGPFLAIKHGAPALTRRGGGAIVCTASVAGLRANAAGLPYSASKAGVISLVQTAANALVGTNIRVNAVCPGLIETGMTEVIFTAARARGSEGKIGQLNPTGRAGSPREVAEAALFLASDAASYINGQALAVDGGLSSTHPFARNRR